MAGNGIRAGNRDATMYRRFSFRLRQVKWRITLNERKCYLTLAE